MSKNNIFKSYFIWILVSFLLAALYVKIILGAKPESSSDFNKILLWLYQHVFLLVSFVLGSFNAFIFVLIDMFYLKKSTFGIKLTVIRLFALVLVTTTSGIIHYFLEKVIDVI